MFLILLFLNIDMKIEDKPVEHNATKFYLKLGEKDEARIVYKILDNEFENIPSVHVTTGIAISGNIPHSIEIKQNNFGPRPRGIDISLPSWHAGENLQISQNNFEKIFNIYFSIVERKKIKDSERTLYLMKNKREI